MTRLSAVALFAFATALLPVPSPAQVVVLDYDGATTPDFELAPYEEDGTVTTVQSGHYEIISDALGNAGDYAFNIDEQETGLTAIRIAAAGGGPFNAYSLDVVNPSEAPGEITIAAVGGPGNVSAPTVGGVFELGPDFYQITALDIVQHQPGSFAFDTVTLPEPGVTASFLLLASVLFALRGRRSC